MLNHLYDLPSKRPVYKTSGGTKWAGKLATKRVHKKWGTGMVVSVKGQARNRTGHRLSKSSRR